MLESNHTKPHPIGDKAMSLCTSKSTIIESLKAQLQADQRKYQYHKKIADGYFELVQKALQKLRDLNLRFQALKGP